MPIPPLSRVFTHKTGSIPLPEPLTNALFRASLNVSICAVAYDKGYEVKFEQMMGLLRNFMAWLDKTGRVKWRLHKIDIPICV